MLPSVFVACGKLFKFWVLVRLFLVCFMLAPDSGCALCPVLLFFSCLGVSTSLASFAPSYWKLRIPREDIHAQLLAVVSHELKTPLNGIVGCAQLLQLSGTMGNEDRKHVKIIAHCSALLDMMIHNILLHQNSENQTPVLEDTDVRSMFQGVLEILQSLVANDLIALTLKIDSTVPSRIRLARTNLVQVLLNLGSNAIKFQRRGGCVAIVVSVFTSAQGPVLLCEVRDNGPGIDKNFVRDGLFKPYRRQAGLHASGTGLGLSICKQLVETMEGQLSYRANRNGSGSIFSILLPLQSNAALGEVDLPPTSPVAQMKVRRKSLVLDQSQTQMSPSELRQRWKHVLIVDDNHINQIVLTSMMQRLGLNGIETLDDGCAALVWLLSFYQTCPEEARMAKVIVFFDMNMPLLGGLQAAQLWRTLEQFLGLKRCVLVWMSADASVEPDGLFFDYALPKPIKLGQVEFILSQLEKD